MKHVHNTSRILLGILFIFSGFVKGIDPIGVSYKFIEYLDAWHLEFLVPIALLLACLLCLVEFGLGVALLTHVWHRAVAWKVMALMCFFTITTLISALTNPITDCGCFGDAIKLGNWETFYKNIFFLILAAIHLFASLKYRGTSAHYCMKKIATIIAIAAFGGFMWYSYTYLPIIDFRPYHEGANIIEGMQVPKGAPADEYKNTFIYENLKTGKQQEFDETNYPWQDTLNWKYMDMQSTLIKKGYEAPIRDFYIMTNDAEDVKDFFLYDELPTFMFISTHIKDAKWKQTAKLQDIIKYCDEKQMSFIGLTASSIDTATNLASSKGLKIEFFNCDEITLKTMIRSNPGLILIQHGTILKKWSINEIPDRKEIISILDKK